MKRILNFGWPQASYGDHYTSNKEERYILAPLFKSHIKHEYEEPLTYYTPSIAISEIENVNNFFATSNNKMANYFAGSLGKDLDNGQLSIHHLKIDYDKPEIIKYDIIQIGERIRDIKYLEELNIVLMFLESSGSIGILEKLNKVLIKFFILNNPIAFLIAIIRIFWNLYTFVLPSILFL